MADIFISYANPDSEWARTLADILEEYGYSVWWDRVIPPGKTFDQVIQEQLDAAKCVIVLWSRQSVASDWVKEEASEAQRRQILVPACIDDTEIPLGFKRVQAAHLVDWKGQRHHREFDLLLAAVKQLVSPLAGPKTQTSQTRIDPAPNQSNWTSTRTTQGWAFIGALKIFLIIAFYFVLVNEANFSDWITSFKDPPISRDIAVAISAVFMIIFIRRRDLSRFAWVIGPVLIYILGMPYGSPREAINRSPLFGIDYSSSVRYNETSLLVVGGLLFALIVLDFV